MTNAIGRRDMLAKGTALLVAPGGPYARETDRGEAVPELTAAGLIALLQEVAPDTPIMVATDGVILRAATKTIASSVVTACARGYYQHDPAGAAALLVW